MARLNHFAIGAALGSTIGPKVDVVHGQIASPQLAATIGVLLERRRKYAGDLAQSKDLAHQFDQGVIRAYELVRGEYSADRIIADPGLNRRFLRACRDLGLENDAVDLNLALLGLRKAGRLKGQKPSKRVAVRDQWRYAVASELAARAMFFRYGVSVDRLFCHPKLAKEFDQLASELIPGFSIFEYRWAALNIRKKGHSSPAAGAAVEDLEWSRRVGFLSRRQLPAEQGVYSLQEDDTCLFFANTDDLRESITTQRRIVEVPLLDPDLWQPDPGHLFWRYAPLPDTPSGVRYGIVNHLVGSHKPVFNIPRGESRIVA
jgi:hypothetical protein